MTTLVVIGLIILAIWVYMPTKQQKANKKFAEENKDRMMWIGIDRCSIKGYENGLVLIRVYNEWNNTTYLKTVDCTEITTRG